MYVIEQRLVDYVITIELSSFMKEIIFASWDSIVRVRWRFIFHV